VDGATYEKYDDQTRALGLVATRIGTLNVGRAWSAAGNMIFLVLRAAALILSRRPHLDSDGRSTRHTAWRHRILSPLGCFEQGSPRNELLSNFSAV
jgi:hypothetical protein